MSQVMVGVTQGGAGALIVASIFHMYKYDLYLCA